MIFALTASGPRQPGTRSELRAEKKVVPAFGFLALLARAEPLGTAGAGMRRDGQEGEECPGLSHPPRSRRTGAPRASAGAPGARRERGARAATGNDTETSPGSNPNLAPHMKERGGNSGRGGREIFPPH